MGYREQRLEPRFNCQQEVIIDNRMFTQCGDISKKGLFIMTPDVLPYGTKVEIYLTAYDLRLPAEIRHAQFGIGMGVRFMPETPEQSAMIDHIISGILHSPDTVNFKLQVLLIDGRFTSRVALADALKLEGFSVTEAEDSMEGIRMLNAFPAHAIAISNELRGKIHFLQLITMIKESPAHKGTPILIYGAKGNKVLFHQAREKGADKFLKPSESTPASISTQIRNLLLDDAR